MVICILTWVIFTLLTYHINKIYISKYTHDSSESVFLITVFSFTWPLMLPVYSIYLLYISILNNLGTNGSKNDNN
jgi:Na+-driven multidrug efflux pump